MALTRKAINALREAGWQASSRAELDEAAARTRVVVVGELHMPDGWTHLRTFQRSLVDAVLAGGGELALGFEPSVKAQQQGVITYAKDKGFTPIPMEVGWKEHLELGLVQVRDDECAAAVQDWLGGGDEHRLVLIRGQAHVLPGGPLLKRLPADAVVVLTIPNGLGVPLALLADSLATPGTVLRSKTLKRVFYVHCDSVGGDHDKWGTELLKLLAK
ncbi:MAG: hypothetical protein R3F30_07400 [Planctomycetota bacterium]